MTDAPEPTPDVPRGWAAEQPPPYGGASTPWVAPGGQDRPGSSPGPGAVGPGASGTGPQPPSGPGPGPYGHRPPQYGPPPGPYAFRPPEAPRPGIVPLRPLTLGDLLDGSIKLIRTNPKATLGLSAIVAAISTVPTAIGQATFFRVFGTVAAEPEAAEPPLAGIAVPYLGSLISLALTFVSTTILTGILTRVLGRAVFGGRITAGEAWRLARPRVPALFGLVLLKGLILTAPILLATALIVSLALTGTLTDLSDAQLGAVVGLGLLLTVLLYIPYVLFFETRFSLAAAAMVLEGRGVSDSLRRSWRLVRGDSWRVLGILLLTYLIVGVLSGVLSMPFSMVGLVIGTVGQGSIGAAVTAGLLMSVGGVLSSMISYPFQAGVNGLLYADRRMRAEAFDLVLQTAAARNQALGWVHAGVDDLWHPANAAGTGPWAGPAAGAAPGSSGPRP